MNTLWMAKRGEKVLAMTYAKNEIQAQNYFIQFLPSVELEKGFTSHDTQAQENSPAAKLLIAIFGDDES